MSRMLPWLGAALCAAGMVWVAGNRCWAADPRGADDPFGAVGDALAAKNAKTTASAASQGKKAHARAVTTVVGLESEAERRIEEALDQPTTIDFVETPLQDVVDYLKEKHKIEIQIDNKAFQDVGLAATDVTITKNLKGISLRSALRLILRELDLTFVIRDEVLFITTPEQADTKLATRFYLVPDEVVCRIEPGKTLSNGEGLAYLINSVVFPTTWDEVGGPASIVSMTFNGVEILVISQTFDAHAEIAKLLESLRKVAPAR